MSYHRQTTHDGNDPITPNHTQKNSERASCLLQFTASFCFLAPTTGRTRTRPGHQLRQKERTQQHYHHVPAHSPFPRENQSIMARTIACTRHGIVTSPPSMRGLNPAGRTRVDENQSAHGRRVASMPSLQAATEEEAARKDEGEVHGAIEISVGDKGEDSQFMARVSTLAISAFHFTCRFCASGVPLKSNSPSSVNAVPIARWPRTHQSHRAPRRASRCEENAPLRR